MRLLKNISIVTMITVFTFSFLHVAYAQTLQNFDAKILAQKAVKNELTEEFIKALSYDEFMEIAKEVAFSNGANEKEVGEFFLKNRKTFQRNFYSYILGDFSNKAQKPVCQLASIDVIQKNIASFASSGPCSQQVELGFGSRGATYASYYVVDWGCDGDWSDSEYRFDYYTNWGSVNSDDIRWWSWNGWVLSVLSSIYGDLAGLNLCNIPKSLCVGKNTIDWFLGGPIIFQGSVFIWR